MSVHSERWILITFLTILSLFIPHPRGYNVDELEDHIAQLHEYNDIKDVGQMLLGKLGERQNSGAAASGRRDSPDPRVVRFCPWVFRLASSPPTLLSCPTP